MNLPVDLQKNEKVILIAHRHIVFLMLQLAGTILVGLVPPVILLVIAGMNDGTLRAVLLGLAIIWGLFGIVTTYFAWYRYQNDIWIITDQRIIDSTKFNWFHHKISSADLVNVEDMTVTRSGVLPTMFNYGDLHCQTAGMQDNFILKGIPEPSKVLDIVDGGRDAARQKLGYRPQSRGVS